MKVTTIELQLRHTGSIDLYDIRDIINKGIDSEEDIAGFTARIVLEEEE